MIDSAGIPGLSVALIEDGNVSWSKGLGVKDKDTKEPVSDNTIFRGASLGKPIFAYAVLQLSEQGKIALDTPLEKYISAGILRGSFSKGRPDR